LNRRRRHPQSTHSEDVNIPFDHHAWNNRWYLLGISSLTLFILILIIIKVQNIRIRELFHLVFNIKALEELIISFCQCFTLICFAALNFSSFLDIDGSICIHEYFVSTYFGTWIDKQTLRLEIDLCSSWAALCWIVDFTVDGQMSYVDVEVIWKLDVVQNDAGSFVLRLELLDRDLAVYFGEVDGGVIVEEV